MQNNSPGLIDRVRLAVGEGLLSFAIFTVMPKGHPETDVWVVAAGDAALTLLLIEEEAE